jgi:3-phosphoshikimate 1-carboxyvinyltransferase
MNQIVNGGALNGSIDIPASKSFTQRAMAAALLCNNPCTLYNVGNSNDERTALSIIQQLGAEVLQVSATTFKITSRLNCYQDSKTINVYESGLSVRMFTSILALMHKKMTVIGHGSLASRPLHIDTNLMEQLAVTITTTNGYIPFTVQGPLLPKNIIVDGSKSSQFLTGLLLAYAYSNIDATIEVTDLVSKPYIDITISVIEDFGLNVPTNVDYRHFVFTKKEYTHKNISYHIESDWSSASFFCVGAAINGKLCINNLVHPSKQADAAILAILKKANANITVKEGCIEIATSKLAPFEYDLTDCPDLFPPLVALAANISGTTILHGVSRLANKESNRALTLKQEFEKLGININLHDDTMSILSNGKPTVNNTVSYSSHNDHRIAMALAIAITNTNQSIKIDGAEAINKSFPSFFNLLESLKK